MTENTCWEGLELIFRKAVDVRTQREHKGRLKILWLVSLMGYRYGCLKMLALT
jgi:hypothetical protein